MDSKNERNSPYRDIKMGYWQFNLPPKPDEILSSWLIRNSIANGSDPAHFSTAIWDKWRSWTLDFDRSIPSEKLELLSISSGISVSELYSLTLSSVIDKVFIARPDILTAWKWVIPTGNRNRIRVNGMHFCPHCLASSPHYFKKLGRFAWNTVCPIHKCQLVSLCPQCNATVAPHLVTYDKPDVRFCSRCGFFLPNCPILDANTDALLLQNLLNRCISSKPPYDFPLDICSVHELFEVVRFFMVFFLSLYKKEASAIVLSKELDCDLTKKKEKVMMEQRSNEQRHLLMVATSRILTLSEDEIINLLVSANVTQSGFMCDNHCDVSVLKDMKNCLPSIKRKRSIRKIYKEELAPRSKDEVDELFKDIEIYL